MKLYATVTSERASKGQGGNKYLDIDITVGDAEKPRMLAQLTARYSDDLVKDGAEEDGSGYVLVDSDDNLLFWAVDTGKKQ